MNRRRWIRGTGTARRTVSNGDVHDVAIIGGGILGLATAWRLLQRQPRCRIVLFEKEAAVARHQTGRNSGVLHSGIYYRPGSRKARTCRRGRQLMEAFCTAEGIPHERCGKVIVATAAAELPRLDAILARGRANGVACERIERRRLDQLEPAAAGLAALHVPEAGIVDYRAVCERLAVLLRERGAELHLGSRVTAIRRHRDAVVVHCDHHPGQAARRLVNCAGLHCDRLSRLAGHAPPVRIVPFRGEYYQLRATARTLCRNLIYPVPDPAFPFLGVHLTRAVDGSVVCGPNAVLAWAREGYRWGDLRPRDLLETLRWPGFQRLALRHLRTGCAEQWRSLSKRAFVHELQRLVPALRASDLEPASAGVRAQALRRDGRLVDDFLICGDGPVIHVLNAPSPAATAAFAIAEVIVRGHL